MKDSNFYSVQGWMVNRLGLKGNELICYAVIYCFCQDEESQYMGGVKYLQGWMNATEPTVLKALSGLVDKGLLEKHDVNTEMGKRCYYSVTKESLVPPTKESLVKNNIYIDINNEELNNKNISLSDDNSCEQPDTLDELFEQFWNLYGKKKGKAETRKVWDKLSKADRQKAIDAIEPYKRSMRYETRYMRDPVRYLRHKTWLDDFDTMNRKTFYDIQDGDSERVVSYKLWMRKTYPNIEEARKPLTYDEYLRLFNEYSRDELREQLEYLNENIVRYRNSCIAEEIAYYLKKKREAAA